MNMGSHNVILKHIKEKIVSKPVFLMMVGIAGSGKSSVAIKLRHQVLQEGLYKEKQINILSSDNLREELLGDINEQSQNDMIFAEMKKRTINTLKEGHSVIYDATNLNVKDRRGILNAIEEQKIDCFRIAYIIPTTLTQCVVNATNRNRIVPFDVLQRMLHKFQIPIYQEGFHFIFVEGYNYSDFSDSLYESNIPIDYRPYILLDKLKNFNQETHYHKFSLLEHSILAYEEVLRHTRKYGEKDFSLEQAALFHDLGKIKTKVKNDKGEYSYYGHANVGAYEFLQNLDWLGFRCFEQAIYCVALINYHMEPFGWEEAKASTVEKKKRFFGDKMYNDLMLLHKADMYASTGEKE